jgi:major membrane immunogen (membrane-anchored lipoprotein)
MKQSIFLLLTVLLLGSLVTGCGPSSKMTGSWVDKSYTGGAVRGEVLVVGVARNQTHRHIFEDSLVNNLRARGVDAVASYTIAPEEIQGNEAAIREVVKKSGASAVLVTHVIGSEERSRYFPAMGATLVDYGYYGGLYSYYPQVFHFVYMPAQNTSTETVTLESSLYDTADGHLIWIGRANATNPEMTKKFYISLTRQVVAEMRKNKVL